MKPVKYQIARASKYSKWYLLRWLIPAVFVLGYFYTVEHLFTYEARYMGLSLVSFMACTVLLTQMGRPFIEKLPVWMGLVLFVSIYYLKFYIVISNPLLLPHTDLFRFYYMIKSPDILYEVFRTITYGFVVFCMVSTIYLFMFQGTINVMPTAEINYIRVMNVFMVISIVLVVSLGMLNYALDQKMGAAVVLPYKLAGMIRYLRAVFLVLLLLTVVHFSDIIHSRLYFLYGIMLILMQAVSDMFLRSSRGSVMMYAFYLLILFIMSRNLSLKRIQLFFMAILLTIPLWIIITPYRYLRMGNEDMGVFVAIEEIVQYISYNTSSLWDTVYEATVMIAFRMLGAGADSLIAITGSNLEPLHWKWLNMNVSKEQFTTIVMGFPADSPHGQGPSILGWYYLVGGDWLVVVGTFLYVTALLLAWRLIMTIPMYTKPAIVALFLFLFNYYFIISGGVFEQLSLLVFIYTVNFALVEMMARVLGGIVKNLPGYTVKTG